LPVDCGLGRMPQAATMDLWLLGVEGVREGSLLSIRVGSSRCYLTFGPDLLGAGGYKLPVQAGTGCASVNVEVFESKGMARTLHLPFAGQESMGLCTWPMHDDQNCGGGVGSSGLGMLNLAFEMRPSDDKVVAPTGDCEGDLEDERPEKDPNGVHKAQRIDIMEQGPIASSITVKAHVSNKTAFPDDETEDSACNNEGLVKEVVIDGSTVKDSSIIWEPVLPPQTPGVDSCRSQLQCQVSPRSALPSEQLPDVRLRRGPSSRFSSSTVPALTSRRCPLTPARLSPRVPANPFEPSGGYSLRALDNSCLHGCASARSRSTQGHGPAVGSARNAASQLGEERRGQNTPLLSLTIPKLTWSRRLGPQEPLAENGATKQDPSVAKDSNTECASAPKDENPEDPSTAKDAKMEEPCIATTGTEANARPTAETGATKEDSSAAKDAKAADSSASKDDKPEAPSVTMDKMVEGLCIVTDGKCKVQDATEDSPTAETAPTEDCSAANDANAEDSSTPKDDRLEDPSVAKDTKVEETCVVTDGKCSDPEASRDAEANAKATDEAGKTEMQLAGSRATGNQSAKIQAASRQDNSLPEDRVTVAQDNMTPEAFLHPNEQYNAEYDTKSNSRVNDQYSSRISEVATNCSTSSNQVARLVASECRASLTSQWGA